MPVSTRRTRGADGEYMLEKSYAQDVMAWETQGPIAKRHLERLGTTDRGVIMFRQMLERELQKIEQGLDPLGTIRDPAKNEIIELPVEIGKDMNSDGFALLVERSMVGCADVGRAIVAVYGNGRRPAPAAGVR